MNIIPITLINLCFIYKFRKGNNRLPKLVLWTKPFFLRKI